MSYKPDERDWMAYLYGELDDTDRHIIDQYLLQHPEARMQLQKLQNLRQMLSAAEDKEIIAPPIFIEKTNSGTARPAQRFFWNRQYFNIITAVAASLLLIIMVGKLTGLQISVSGGEMRLSFGKAIMPASQETQQTSSLSAEQIQEMINLSLNRNNAMVQASLKETQETLDASIRKNLALSSGKMDQLAREASSASQNQIREFVDGIRTENMEQVKNYFQLTSTEQKKYIENLLVDFAKYLQQQRNDDLQLVQTRLTSIEQNTDLFKHETEQILSSIITTVGNPVKSETKN
jgi:hypothetical protein